jgi:hypothetical protein
VCVCLRAGRDDGLVCVQWTAVFQYTWIHAYVSYTVLPTTAPIVSCSIVILAAINLAMYATPRVCARVHAWAWPSRRLDAWAHLFLASLPSSRAATCAFRCCVRPLCLIRTRTYSRMMRKIRPTRARARAYTHTHTHKHTQVRVGAQARSGLCASPR